MRKSTAMVLTIMMVAFGAMFAAAGSALKPLAADADVSKELTRFLHHRGDLATETRVRAFRLPASEERLADEGRGLVIRIVPNEAVRTRRNGLRMLAQRVAQEGLALYPNAKLSWVEVVFRLSEEAADTDEGTLRTLLPVGPEGRIGKPEPQLPMTHARPEGA